MKSRVAFSLIEVLLVLAVISLLAAMLLPVLGRVREMARRTNCVSQLRQVGLGLRMYEDDYDELPPLLSRVTKTYVDKPLLACKSDPERGQHNGNARLEGNLYLNSGVSYEYLPNWQKSIDLGWYNAGPNYGDGKWQEMTPLVGCMWHWAKWWDPDLPSTTPKTSGWHFYLTRGGAVRRVRIEEAVENFVPEKLR